MYTMSETTSPSNSYEQPIDQVNTLLDLMGVEISHLELPQDPTQYMSATTQTVGDSDDA